jgi:hypothetical protein
MLTLDILFSVLLLFETKEGLDSLEPVDFEFPVKLEPSLGLCLGDLVYRSGFGLLNSNC